MILICTYNFLDQAFVAMDILVSLVSDGPNSWMRNEIKKEPNYEDVLHQVDEILKQWDYNIDLEVMFSDFQPTFELLKLSEKSQCQVCKDSELWILACQVCQHYALWTLAFATRKMNSKKEHIFKNIHLLLFSQIFLSDVVFSKHCKLFVQQDGNICLNDAISDTNPEIPRRNHDLKSIIEENIDFWKNQREARKANLLPLVDIGITNLDEGMKHR